MNKYVEWTMNTWIYFKEKLHKRNADRYQPSVLLVTFHPLGDTVIESPVFKALRKNYPRHHIMVVCSKRNKELLEYCPYIDELLVYDNTTDKHFYQINLQRCYEFANKYFQKRHFELAIITSIFMPSIVEAWLIYLSHADRRASFSERLNPVMHREYMGSYDRFFTDVFFSHHQHDVLEYRKMLEILGCPMESDDYELWTTKEDGVIAKKIYLEEHIDKKKPICVVALNSSEKARDWSVKHYINVCNKLEEKYDIEYIVVGAGEQGQHDGNLFCKYVKNAHNLVNKTTIRQLVEVIKNADYYLGCDTGAMHIAAAAHLRGVALFKSADNTCWMMRNHECHYPWHAKIKALHPKKAIQGCENGCKKNKPHCINLITVEEVYQAMLNVLKAKER